MLFGLTFCFFLHNSVCLNTLQTILIYKHIAPGQWQTTPWGKIIFKMLIWSFAASFFPFNYFVTVFPFQTHRQPNLTMPLNRSRSTQGNNLKKLCSAQVPLLYAKFQDHRTLGLEKNNFKGFGHNMDMGAILGHVTKTIL